MKKFQFILLLTLALISIFLPFKNSTLVQKWAFVSNGYIPNVNEAKFHPDGSGPYFTFDVYGDNFDNWMLIPQSAKKVNCILVNFDQILYLLSVPPEIVRHRPRLVLITVEDSAPQIHEFEKVTPYRVNSDLVLPTLATIAKHIGFDVGVFNEFLQGAHAPISELVQPGDIIGFSVLASGTERFIKAASEAYNAGASYVIAGGDAVQFRPHVALNHCDAVVYRDGWGHVADFLQRLYNDNPPTEPPWGIMTSEFSEGVLVDNRDLKNSRRDKHPAPRLSWVNDDHMLPSFGVYSQATWETIWKSHRRLYGHRIPNPESVKIGPISLAWGCTKTGNGIACEHCSISLEKMGSVAHVDHLQQLRDIHQKLGHNFLFANQPDGGYLLSEIPKNMLAAGFNPEWIRGMELYGLLQDIANKPDLLHEWLKVTEYLVLNASPEGVGEHAGMGSGKTYGTQSASEVYAKNWSGLQAIKAAGPRVGWHGAFIFGMPGATENDYKAILDEVPNLFDLLGEQVWYLEGHLFILSIGAPFANNVIESYDYAAKKALELSGKNISYDNWWNHFGRHQFSLAIPEEDQTAYFEYFTRTSRELALLYGEKFGALCAQYGLPGTREFVPG